MGDKFERDKELCKDIARVLEERVRLLFKTPVDPYKTYEKLSGLEGGESRVTYDKFLKGNFAEEISSDSKKQKPE